MQDLEKVQKSPDSVYAVINSCMRERPIESPVKGDPVRYCNTFFKLYTGLDPAKGSTDLPARCRWLHLFSNPAENRPEGIVVPVACSHKPRAVLPQ